MLHYIADYGVLICSIHGYAIQDLDSHLKRLHEMKAPERTALVQQYKHITLISPDKVRLPCQESRPFPYLKVYDGFKCNECSYLLANRKSIRNHCNTVHNWKVMKSETVHWQEVTLQTFFNSKFTKYFIVQKQNSEDSEDGGDSRDDGDGKRREESQVKHTLLQSDQQLMHGITKHWRERQRVQEKQQDVLADTIQKHETTNWLNYTGWPALFRNKDIKKIAHTSWIPGRNETELKRICKLIDNLFDRCINGLRILPQEILCICTPEQHCCSRLETLFPVSSSRVTLSQLR